MHDTLAQLEKLGRIQAQQREAIATKANDFDTQERHEALVAETKEGAKSLHDRAEQLGTSINASGAVPVGPPWKTQSERRDWLLQEKRKWLVEMRLQGQKPPGGGGGGGYSGDEGSPDGLFPPIAHPRALIGGHQIDTIATPRHYG